MPPRAWPLRRPRVLPGGVSASARRRNDPVFFLCARYALSGLHVAGHARSLGAATRCVGRRAARGPSREVHAAFFVTCSRRLVCADIHERRDRLKFARARRTALVSPSSILTFLYSQSLCGLGPGSRAGAGPMSRPFPGIRHGLAQPAAAGIHHTIARWTIRSWAMDAGRWHAVRRSNRRSHSLRQHQSAKNG